MFECLFERLNNFYEKIFTYYGIFISKYYLYTIIVSFLVNVILSIGIFKLNIITNSDELYTLINSQAKHDEYMLKDLFISEKFYNEKYFMHQLIDFGTWTEINFHVKSEIKNDNILNKTYIDEIRQVHELIVNNLTVIVEIANNTNNSSEKLSYKFDDLCAKRFHQCVIDGLALIKNDFFDWLKSKSGEIKLKEDNKRMGKTSIEPPVKSAHDSFLSQDTIYSSGFNIIDLKYNLGRNFKFIIDNNDRSNNSGDEYAYANIVKLRYSLRSNYETASYEIKQWEIEFIRLMKSLKLNYLTYTFSASQSFDIEMLNNISFDVLLIGTTFTLITFFAIILMSLKSNMITSPGIMLPLSGILSATFASTSSFGFLSYVGYPACNLIFVIPFLILGIGIDDMFIIYSSFMHTNVELSTSERISQALSKSGVSITITSLTDFVAFLVGLSAGFKSVQIFCIYAAFAILACYIYQLTFFAGWLVIHANRIKSRRNAFIFCIKHEKINKKNEEEADANNGSIELNECQPSIEHSQQQQQQQQQQETKVIDNNRINNNKLKRIRKFISKYWTYFYKFLLCNKIGKLIVFGVFLIYITISVYYTTKIEEGIDVADLVADESYFRAYIKDNVKSLDMAPLVMLAVYEPIDYTNQTIVSQLNYLIDEAKRLDGIKDNFDFNWMSIYKKQLKSYTRKNKSDNYLFEIVNDFLPFSNDIIIKYNNSTAKHDIIASRFYVQYENLKFNSKDAIPMNKLRDLCKNSGLPIVAYSYPFKFYEQFEQTLPNIVQAFVIAAEAMYLISLFFIPDLISIMCIIAAMVSIMFGLLGFMHLWSLTLSSVTMIQLVMSIGFCVDFSAHLTHAFIASVGKGNRNERTYKACMRYGLPIFNSALSTIIGVCVLAFCKSYIFISFFKTMFILMLLGVLNSMLFLPVLLSLVGPHWPRHQNIKIKTNTQTNNITNDDDHNANTLSNNHVANNNNNTACNSENEQK